jgi:hypothetical protein
MIAVPVLLLLSGSPLIVELEESTGLSAEESREMVKRLGEAIHASSGRATQIADHKAASSEPRISIRLLGGLRRIRLVAVAHDLVPAGTLERDLPRDAAQWAPILREIAATLVPREQERAVSPDAMPDAVTLGSSAPPAPKSKLVPWILAGVGAAAVGVGIAFAVSAENIRQQAAASPPPFDEYDAINSRHRTQAIAAQLLIEGGALLGALAGVLFVFD